MCTFHSLHDDWLKTIASGDTKHRDHSDEVERDPTGRIVMTASSTVLKKIFAKEDLYNGVDPGVGLGEDRAIMPTGGTETGAGCRGCNKDGSAVCMFKCVLDRLFNCDVAGRSRHGDENGRGNRAYVSTIVDGDTVYIEVARVLQLDHRETDRQGGTAPAALSLPKYIEALPTLDLLCRMDHAVKGWCNDDFTTFRLNFDNYSGGVL